MRVRFILLLSCKAPNACSALLDNQQSHAFLVGSQVGAKVMNEKMKTSWNKQMVAVVLPGVAAKLLWKLL